MAASEEVYAKELFKLSKGYPLWQPEATEDDIEVELGDVGYLDKGCFCRLFNACRERDDPLNNKPHHVPDDFQKFTVEMQPKRNNNAVDPGAMISKSVKKLGGGASLLVYVFVISSHVLAVISCIHSHGAGAAFEFECVENQGAFLIVGSSAPREEFHQTRRMKSYMKKNIDSWYHYMSDVLGIERKLEDILFVKGWVKTTHWAVAAFVERARSAKVKVSGGFSPVAEGRLGFVVESAYSSVDHHTGPGTGQLFPQAQQMSPATGKKKKGKNREPPHQPTDAMARVELRPTQCIFLHYFKLKKRRLFPDKMYAAAELKDPPSSSDEDDYDFEETPVTTRVSLWPCILIAMANELARSALRSSGLRSGLHIEGS